MDKGIGALIGALLIFGTGITSSIVLTAIYDSLWLIFLPLIISVVFVGMFLVYESR